MEQSMVHMGEIIRNMRKQKGHTQEALAQAAGVSVQAVSKWETGQSLPDVALLSSIADFLDITIDALFGRIVPQAAREAAEQVSSPFPNDGRLRVVQYIGDRMMSAEECTDRREIRLFVGKDSTKIDVEIQGSARINGPINGAVHTSGDIFISGCINGSARADGDITCEGRIYDAAQENKTACSVEWNGGLNEAAKGLGSALSDITRMFGRAFSSGGTNGRMEAFFRGELPDDDILRIVQLRGRRILSVGESSGEQKICLDAEHLDGQTVNVEVYGSAEIRGSVGGNVKAGSGMNCGSVSGDVQAGDGVNCGNVGGGVQAGDGVNCGNVSGDVQAGDGLTCGNVEGSVRAGGSVRVNGDVHGNVIADDDVTCGAIGGSVRAERVRTSVQDEVEKTTAEEAVCAVSSDSADVVRVMCIKDGREISAQDYAGERRIRLTFEDAEGVCVTVQGSALIEGDVQGDVYAQGSLVCGDVEGSVYAQGQSGDAQIKCGAVSGSVKAKKISLMCGDVDGDVSAEAENSNPTVKVCGVAGNVTARNASMSCGDVDGDVTAEGKCENPTVKVCGVAGDVTVRNVSVSCGDVDGDVTAEGENKNPTVKVCGVAGNVTSRNVSMSCGDVDGDVTAEGECENPTVECGAVTGDVTARNISLTCGDVDGDVTAEGECENPTVECGAVTGDVTARNISLTCGDVGGDFSAQGGMVYCK